MWTGIGSRSLTGFSVAGVHGSEDPRLGPFGLIAKHVSGKRRRLFDADAAVAEGAAAAREEIVGRRVVQIDVVADS